MQENLRYRAGRDDRLPNSNTLAAGEKLLGNHELEQPKYKQKLSQQMWAMCMLIYYLGIFVLIIYSFHHLPQPKLKQTANPDEFIEEIARSHLNELLKNGHRPSGSVANEVDAVNYILKKVEEISLLSSSSVKFEVDLQRPTGSFTIDFLQGFANYYSNVTNTVVRLSPVKPASNHALLLNCHTDSVSGGPGASDDAVACAVLLEVMRALVVDHETPFLHPIIFLFNGAEENVLQGSHGFITKHRWAKQVKAFINLEAAGAGGKEIVFQTGPSNPWLAMTWAAHAPHPFGTVVGQELFQSGVIPSDTDFRIFRDFGKIPGIDLAYMRNGYVYHTVYDNADMIPPGSIQRAGDNILAVVHHLVKSKSSLLPKPSSYKHGSTAFMDILGLKMLIIPDRLLSVLNWMCCIGSFLYIMRRMIFTSDSSTTHGKLLTETVVVIIFSWIASILSVSVLSGLVTSYGNIMSFFSKPFLVVFLYAFPCFATLLTVHLTARKTIFKAEDIWKMESIVFDAYLLLFSVVLFLLNYSGMQSSLMLLISAAPVFLTRCLLLRHLFKNHDVDVLSRSIVYLAALVPHSLVAFYHGTLVMEFFIPLCGRLGHDAPPDLVIGVITALVVCLASHFSLSLVYAAKSLQRVIVVLLLISAIAFGVACSSYGFPYSVNPTNPTPKRLYIQHTARSFYGQDGKLTSSDSGLWVNTFDYAGFSLNLGDDALHQRPSLFCLGLFCHFPFVIPVQGVIRYSRYPPAAIPVSHSITKHPHSIEFLRDNVVLLAENSTMQIYRRYLQFRINGPDHMSLQLAPLSSKGINAQLTRWSIEGFVEDASTQPTAVPTDPKFSYSDWYFLCYGSGLDPGPWEPWIEVTVFQNVDLLKQKTFTSEPVIEVGFSAHYYPDSQSIPPLPQTEDLLKFLSNLKDWVTPISWISFYENYLL